MDEYSSGHIAGSINVQADKLEQHLLSSKHPKESPIILVCKTGSSSKSEGINLINGGYLDVNVINGGIMTWQGSGLPLSK